MRRKELVLLILLLFALLPYFLVCFTTLPFADDFCYGWTSAEKIPFIQRFLRQYMHWSGRYSAHVFLCNHPLVNGHLSCYRACILVTLMGTLMAVLAFIHRIIGDFTNSLIIAFTSILFYLCYTPQLTEGVYWYTGICNYELGNVCFILHLAALLLALDSKGLGRHVYWCIAVVMLVASIGFNEIGAAVIPAYYLLAVILFYKSKRTSVTRKTNGQGLLILFLTATLSSAFVVFAPGNFVRSHQFQNQFNFAHSIIFASMQTGRFIATWLSTLPAWAFSILLLAKADKLPDDDLLQFNYPLILMLLLFTVFMSAFIPYFNTGILGQYRTLNYSFFFFIYLWIWLLISISKKYALHKKMEPYLNSNRTAAIIAMAAIVMVFTSNGQKVLNDWRKNNFMTYQEEFMLRQENIIHYPEMEIPPLQHLPESFRIVDARGDSTWWVNKCIKYFYRDTRITLK